MELTVSIYIYIIIVVVLICLLYHYRIKTRSAVILSIIIGQILLNIMTPPSSIDSDEENGSSYAIYMSIQLLTPIVVFIYAISIGIKDRF